MKTPYLAVYSYGTGGVWANIAAHSKEEIKAKYPVLKVFDTRPSWMLESDYESIVSTSSLDIDDEPPEWLTLAMKKVKHNLKHHYLRYHLICVVTFFIEYEPDDPLTRSAI
jgi:hypothetical protein